MLHIIVNPHSGRGKLTSMEFCRQLKRENIPFCLHMTAGKGDAGQLAATLSLGEEDRLLLLGGDGSLNNLVNALSLPTPTLMLIPTGSGNDFARGLHMKRSIAAALSILKTTRKLTPCLLDCGEARVLSRRGASSAAKTSPPRRFLVSCGIGYDAGVCHAINRSPVKPICNRLHLGKLAYLILGIREIFQYKKASAVLTLDDGSQTTYHNLAFLSVHNLPCEGGGFPFAPGANARDGLLNICAVTAKNRLTFTLTLLLSLLGGKHILLKNVHQISCRQAHIHTDSPLPFHTDGEVTPQVTDFTVRCLEQTIPFLYVAGQG